MSSRTEETIVSKGDGSTKLFVRKWSPPARAVAKVLIVHGFLEHGGRYRELAEYLASEHGIATIVYDVRGHGKSSGQRAYCSGTMKDYLDDFETLLEYTQTTSVSNLSSSSNNNENDDDAALPIFVLAHSFGGLTFLDYAREQSLPHIRGVILSAPFVGMALKVPPIKVFASKLLGSLVPRLPVPGEKLLLTHDPVKQEEHDTDPLILDNVTTGWVKACLEAQDRVCGTVPLPLSMAVLYLIAGQDQVSDVKDVTTVGNNIEQKDKTVVVRDEDYHEMLNELKRHQVFELIAEWIHNRRSSSS